MKPAFRIILALPLSLAACGHSKPDLFLDQASTALGCGSANARDCGASGHADAGSPPPELDACYADGDCEYGEECERRHGVSVCQPEDARHADGSGYGDDSSSDDDGHGGHGGNDRPDGGAAACDAAVANDDHPKGSDDCSHDDEGEDRYGDQGRDEERSGSNSGRH